MTITIGELKTLLANLPDDYLIETDTAGDYETYLQVRRPDDSLYADLDDLLPFETPAARADRLKQERKPTLDFVNFLNAIMKESE